MLLKIMQLTRKENAFVKIQSKMFTLPLNQKVGLRIEIALWCLAYVGFPKENCSWRYQTLPINQHTNQMRILGEKVKIWK